MMEWVSRWPIRNPDTKRGADSASSVSGSACALMSGVLEVQSEPGAGTHVSLTVPLGIATDTDTSHEH